MTGGFSIEWEIKEGADIKKLNSDIAGRDGDLDDVVSVRGRDSIIRTLETLTLEDLIPEPGKDKGSFTDKIVKNATTRLQDEFDSQGWPIRVISIYSNGFEFDPASESKIAELVALKQDAAKLTQREENARKAQKVLAEEAKADAAYIEGLIKGGMPADQAATALCLKQANVAGRSNEPFSPGCFAGTSSAVRAVVTTPSPAPKN